jgi:hypothetical protein
MTPNATNLPPGVPPNVTALPRIDSKQDLALTAIVAGATDAEAAAKAGVRRETVHRWRHADPDFIAELARRRRELWDGQVEQLRQLFAKAIGALSDALDTSSPPMVRLKAASVVLRAVGMEEQSLSPGRVLFPVEVVEAWIEEERERRKQAELQALLRTAGL